MMFELDKKRYKIKRLPRSRLFDTGWKELDLQKLLFENIEKIFQDEELLLIMQSRKWQEEPDLMAIDKNGDLYIFELKAWESQDINLLQALRYGQVFGQYTYESLNEMYLKFFPQNKELINTLNNKFNSNLNTDEINTKQHFIIITNGLDFKTRRAIIYWKNRGLDIRSWIYRIYNVNNQHLIEFNTFSLTEDPNEDIDEGYYILNTNYINDPKDDQDMLKNKKAAAYFDPWKRNIEKLRKKDRVFLYRSGTGIIASGIATGNTKKKAFHDDPKYKNEEYYQTLDKFRELKKPLPASEIKKITDVNYRFMSTMFSIDKKFGDILWEHVNKNCI